MTRVWTQVRSVEAGEVDLTGLNLDIKVRKPKEDPLGFDVQTWNLSRDSWSRIDKGDLVRIRLGWDEADVATVCLGKIETAKPSRDGRDKNYRLKGVDESEAATKTRISGRWRNRSPDEIVSAIAGEIGLTPIVKDVGDEIDGAYSVTREQQVRAWLDELLDYAADMTGAAWEWFASRGRLHFVPQTQETVDAPTLSYDNTLLSIQDTTEPDDDVDEKLEFEAMLEPAIEKGAAVYVDTEDFEGAYRVDEYEFQSSTESGDHLVRGKCTPIEAARPANQPTYGGGRGRTGVTR
ncbi:hypothetical protein ACERIT_06130 [Halopenitus sp. H-Gu1]|uniref:hypothetical protein n=1 Tax=Halopenitus sp. H-Gu1 TaxID=3242697 RepID=UPI00359CEE6F